MIAGNNCITVLDVESGMVTAGQADSLFRKYIERSKTIPNGSVINFESGKMYIRSGAGWSKLHSIAMIDPSVDQMLYEITISSMTDKVQICVDGSQLIPIWNPDQFDHGFHGEVKYHHDHYHPYEINVNNHSPILYSSLTDCSSPLSTFKDIISIEKCEKPITLYKLETKPHFYNCNGIYINDDIL